MVADIHDRMYNPREKAKNIRFKRIGMNSISLTKVNLIKFIGDARTKKEPVKV